MAELDTTVPAAVPSSVSVVVPAWNAQRFVAHAIRSAQEQTCPPAEIIVVDDGSTDRTADVAAACTDGHVPITVLRLPHGGPAAARSAGVRATRGSFVALLDADDLWVPQKLERQLERFRLDPRLDAVFTQAQNFFDGVAPREPTGVLTAWVPSAALIRREAFAEHGDFGDDTELASDWVPWFLRLRERGAIGVVEELLVLRRIHDANTGVRLAHQRQAYVRHIRAALRARAAVGTSQDDPRNDQVDD